LVGKGRLRHLQLLVAIADLGSLKRAAGSLGLTQPAATQALAELERVIGDQLFERHSRGMTVRKAGIVMVNFARQTLHALEASAESLGLITQGHDLIRIGVIPATAALIAGPIAGNLQRLKPNIRIEIEETSQEVLKASLSSGALDMAITRRTDWLIGSSHFTPLFPDEPVVLAGDHHPSSRRRGMKMSDLTTAQWIFPPSGWAREIIEQLMTARERTKLRVHPISTYSLPIVAEILRNTETLVVAPKSIIRSFPDRSRVSILDVSGLGQTEPIGVVVSEEQGKRRSIQAFVKTLIDEAGNGGFRQH